MKKTTLKSRASKFVLLVLFLSSLGNISAQNEQKKGEKVKQLKIAYFTEELNLTSSESEKFWPIYNELETKLKTNRKENKKTMNEISSKSETLTDEELKKSVLKIFDNEIEETNLRKEYYSKIALVIGYKKSTHLLKLEKDFNQKLLKELKQKKNSNQPNK